MTDTTTDTTDEQATEHTTLAVGLACGNCGGTSTTVLPEPADADEDDDPDLDSLTWACPHCPRVEPVGDAYDVEAFDVLAAPEAEVDAMDALDDQPATRADDVMPPSMADDYRAVVLLDQTATAVADYRDVEPHTVRANVSRARKAIRGVWEENR